MFYYIVIKYYSISYIWIFDNIKISIDILLHIRDNYRVESNKRIKGVKIDSFKSNMQNLPKTEKRMGINS